MRILGKVMLLCALGLLLAGLAGCAYINVTQQQLDDFKKDLDNAKSQGVDLCAPVEYAQAEVYFEGSKHEAWEVDYNSIVYMKKAKKSLDAAWAKFKAKQCYDTDKDGLSDLDEVKVYKTDPLNPDTDGDGYGDGVEVKAGTNPLDHCSFPKDMKPTYPVKRECPPPPIVQPPKRVLPLISAFENVYFKNWSYEILNEAGPKLDADAKLLIGVAKDFPGQKLRVVGYCSSPGSKQLNDKLSIDRANAVRNELLKRGVSPDMLKAEGRGATAFKVQPDKTEAEQALNRRVEFEYE